MTAAKLPVYDITGAVTGNLQTYRNDLGDGPVDSEAVTPTDPTGIPYSETNPFPVSISGAAVVISTANSFDTETGSPVPTNASPWIGTLEDASEFIGQGITFWCDQPTVKGTVQFTYQTKVAGTITEIDGLPIPLFQGNIFIPVALANVGPIWKIKFTPDAGGPAITKARITTLHYRTLPPDLTRFLTQPVSPQEPVKITRALIEANPYGARSILGADRSLFGDGLIASRVSQVSAQWNKTIAQNRVTTAVTGTGGVTTSNSELLVTSGAGTGSASLQSVKTLKYAPRRSLYHSQTFRLVPPTVAGNEIRFGVYNANHGVYLRCTSTGLAVVTRRNAVDTVVERAAWNGDPMDGSALTAFSGDVVHPIMGDVVSPEALDVTKYGVLDIEWGHLGVFPIEVRFADPRGRLHLAHRINRPNRLAQLSLLDPNMPARMEVLKPVAEATNITIGCGSYDVGIITNPYGLKKSEINNGFHVNETADVPGGAAASTATIYTVTSGQSLEVTQLHGSVSNALSTGGELTITDGVAGPIRYRKRISVASGVTQALTQFDAYFGEEPMLFLSAVVVNIAAVGAAGGASAGFVGTEFPT